MEIKHYAGLNYTPAMEIASEGVLDLTKNGFGRPILTLNWDMNAILAEIEGVSAGVIVWTKIDYVKEVFIHLGYVRPQHRRLGIYRNLWDELVKKARELNADHISSGTHINNAAMRDVSRKLGRVEEAVMLFYQL